MNKSTKRYVAECIGTAVLVLVGCGAVAIGGLTGNPVINVAAIGLAFGLAVMAVIYGLGPISGAHINPAVTVAFALSRHFPRAEVHTWPDCGHYLLEDAGELAIMRIWEFLQRYPIHPE